MFEPDHVADPDPFATCGEEASKPPQELAVDEGGSNDNAHDNSKRRSKWFSLDGNKEAKGTNYGGIARGAISMSNVYLANSMIHLACKAAGGFDPEGERCVNNQLTIYGMKPAALISNIAVASSVLSALLMPLFGAIIDYTPHRKWVGVGTAALLTIITGIQIGTVDVSILLRWTFLCNYVANFSAA